MTVGEFLISRLPALRVHPQVLPQDAELPAVTYTQVSRTATHAFGGDVPVIKYRVQVDIWTETYAEARSTSMEVRAALSRYRDVDVQDVLLANELDGFDDGTRRVTQDYFIFMNESE